MAEFRTLCRLAANSSIEDVHRILERKAKKAGLELEASSIGSLHSWRICSEEVDESVSTDGSFITIEEHSGHPQAYSASKRPRLLTWLLDADAIPGTEKPFSYHDKEAYILTMDNLAAVSSFFDEERSGLLPIVYIPYGCITDAAAMQNALRAQAHVIAEGDASMRAEMAEHFLIDHPADNAVRIYYPSGPVQDIDLSSYLSQSERMNVIVYAVTSTMKHDERLGYLNWSFISDEDEDDELDEDVDAIVEEAQTPVIEISDDKEELVSMVQNLIDELDGERQAKHKAQLDAKRWKSLYESRPADGRVSLECSEKDLYLGECRDAILYLVDSRIREIESGERDPGKLRYYHILKSIQESNSKEGEGERLRKDIEDALMVDSIASLRSGLAKLGFDELYTSGHLRFSFCHDERYTLVLSSTPSDRAGRRNAGSNKVMKSFFPF